MKKAVIVIDMPKNCDECRFNYDMGTRCDALDEGAEHNTRDMYQEIRPCWCPLRPHQEAIPVEWIKNKKVDFQNEDYPFNYTRGVQDGFNECIDYLIDEWEKENERDQISEHKE